VSARGGSLLRSHWLSRHLIEMRTGNLAKRLLRSFSVKHARFLDSECVQMVSEEFGTAWMPRWPAPPFVRGMQHMSQAGQASPSSQSSPKQVRHPLPSWKLISAQIGIWNVKLATCTNRPALPPGSRLPWMPMFYPLPDQ
jgi:hypothetical protein